MKDYKRLGDYIREVNVRNRELEVADLLGLSVNKDFIPSIANNIGTDMSTYKIVIRRQFVYIADTSRRGDKIAISLLRDYDNAIVSQAYTVFEILDHKQLLPEYCYSASLDEIERKGWSLVPSKYIEFKNRDEQIDFDAKMRQ